MVDWNANRLGHAGPAGGVRVDDRCGFHSRTSKIFKVASVDAFDAILMNLQKIIIPRLLVLSLPSRFFQAMALVQHRLSFQG